MRITFAILLFSFFARADEPLFRNAFYSFYFNASQNSMRITTPAGEDIVSSTSFYELLISSSNDTSRMSSVSGSVRTRKMKGLTEVTWIDSNEMCVTTFRVVMSPADESLKFDVDSRFRKEIRVIRNALLVNLSQPVAEVYRRNRTSDQSDFQHEYWLDKEGARFGSADKTFLIYHTPGVSSLQLNTDKSQLIINLDYNKDHPFQYFPLRDSMRNEKQDLSCSIYRAGDRRKNNFIIHAGKEIGIVPRLMQNPNGFLAAHVFTEHADWTDLPTHRAVYFGSEEITSADSATGGFIKNKIPVTKSVFYSNPDSVLNSQSTHQSIFKTPIASIRGTNGYLEFLRQLSKAGTEICLHTPDQFTAKRPLVEEACAFMKKNFDAVTWIDHGYNNGPKNNREAFVCDGLQAGTASYSKDIWEKYGVKYFWNSYYEDFVTADSAFFDFNGSVLHPYPGFGDAAPTPNYWKHPTRTGNFYSWMTRDLLEMPNPSGWNYHFSRERLEDFVKQRAIKIEHCYPAGSVTGSGYWKLNAAGKLIIAPEFENALELLATFRDSGKINLTTIRELLDYWIACEHVTFEYTDGATVKVTNENKAALKGISFAVAAKNISTNKDIHQKNVDGEIIFWFDLKAAETVVLRFSN